MVRKLYRDTLHVMKIISTVLPLHFLIGFQNKFISTVLMNYVVAYLNKVNVQLNKF